MESKESTNQSITTSTGGISTISSGPTFQPSSELIEGVTTEKNIKDKKKKKSSAKERAKLKKMELKKMDLINKITEFSSEISNVENLENKIVIKKESQQQPHQLTMVQPPPIQTRNINPNVNNTHTADGEINVPIIDNFSIRKEIEGVDTLNHLEYFS